MPAQGPPEGFEVRICGDVQTVSLRESHKLLVVPVVEIEFVCHKNSFFFVAEVKAPADALLGFGLARQSSA
jgi:hypothetical protein